MTKKEAKELTVELWTYLAKHPECYRKGQVPEELYAKIEELKGQCPLCEVSESCDECPLWAAGGGCGKYDSPYGRWANSAPHYRETRMKAAREIVKIVAAWEPESIE
jgi:hypothetical protein